MSGLPPGQPRQDELPEYLFQGPFGGVQSEVALSQVERTGFQEVQNLIFRKSHMQTVPGFIPLVSPSNEPIMGIADFFNANGVRLPVVFTPTKMYFWNGAWNQVTGAFTGNITQFFQWDVVGYKIYFSQQNDKVQVWDGITAGFASASGSAVPAKYLLELNFQLLAANTVEAGPTIARNKIRWTGPGAGTDWTSFASGQTDLFNSLGPINGLARLYQAGYAFQQWGITQIVPTGIGLAPFQFITMGSRAKGSILPYGVAVFGEEVAAYIGKDDIYVFDGTESRGIGSHPIDGNRRLGARVRIFSDIFNALSTSTTPNIFGFIMTSVSGFEYESYWLFMPSLNKAWVYHFDEGNWTQVFFATSQLNGPVGLFSLQQIPRIEDLVGTISAQSWSPATLVGANELDTMAIADNNADSISYFSFGAPSTAPTFGSINPDDGWYIKSGQLTFSDSRHFHTVGKVRFMFEDLGAMTFNLRFTNEDGVQSSAEPFSCGTGSGNMISKVVDLEEQITGRLLTWELSGPTGAPVGIVEIAPIYDIGGEVRGD